MVDDVQRRVPRLEAVRAGVGAEKINDEAGFELRIMTYVRAPYWAGLGLAGAGGLHEAGIHLGVCDG